MRKAQKSAVWSDSPRVNPQTDHHAGQDNAPELDELVVTLDGELTSLRGIHFRLAVLRLVLLDGDPDFIQSAAHDDERATRELLDSEPERDRVVSAARNSSRMPGVRFADFVRSAPESHRMVLQRLTRELETNSRAITTLRDAVRRLSEDGRRAVAGALDLTEPEQGQARTGQVFVGDI